MHQKWSSRSFSVWCDALSTTDGLRYQRRSSQAVPDTQQQQQHTTPEKHQTLGSLSPVSTSLSVRAV